jgi:hypothetical protein
MPQTAFKSQKTAASADVTFSLFFSLKNLNSKDYNLESLLFTVRYTRDSILGVAYIFFLLPERPLKTGAPLFGP